jgi:long-chain fatty acid transport protein
MRLLRVASALGLVLVAAGEGRGAGISRPTVVGTRALSLGGAFAAIADDPTAVWHNPAGTAFFGENVAYLGLDLAILGRNFDPSPDSPIGMARGTGTVRETTSPTPIPNIGFSTRFGFGKTKPTRFALSLLAYDAYGGSVSYDPPTVNERGLLSSQFLLFELAPALAYQITDVLSIGASLRIGINSFSTNTVENAFAARLSLTGVGIGASLGIMIRPHRMVSIGAVYRTPLSATLTGGGDVTVGGMNENRSATMSFTWPQSAGLGIAVRPHARLLLSVQGDWTAWSAVQSLAIEVAGFGAPTVRRYRLGDAFGLRFGGQVFVHRMVAIRVGYLVESSAVPDETVRRENQDGLKMTLGGGLGLHFWKMFIDVGCEGLLPISDGRVVVQRPPTMTGFDNEGATYRASLVNVTLAAQIRF